jgi:hypothetical protein
MTSTKQKLLSAALGGMFAASVAFAQEAPDSGKKDEPKMTAMGECHGINACKGQGDCGGKGHECAGKNKCKSKGWKKMTADDCKEKKGKFKKMKM